MRKIVLRSDANHGNVSGLPFGSPLLQPTYPILGLCVGQESFTFLRRFAEFSNKIHVNSICIKIIVEVTETGNLEFFFSVQSLPDLTYCWKPQ